MRQKIDKELLVHLPNEVKSMNLPPKANEILCNFIVMSDNEGWCYSTVNGLAKELQCSTRSIMSNIKLLENKKLILERVIGKKGVATRFKIKLFNENESEKDGNAFNENENAFNENVCNSLNNIEMNGNENENTFNGNENVFDGNSFDGNLSVEEVILLKFKELEGKFKEFECLITKYIESKKVGEKIDDGHIKENKRIEENKKEINNNNNSYTNSSNNVQEVNNTDINNNLNNIENIEINKKENIDLNINESIDKVTCKYKKRKQNDYQYTVEEKDDYNPIVENTKVESIVSKSDGNTSKSEKFLLIGSTSTFSHSEALDYVIKNDLNFDECFKKVEVHV